MVIMMNNICSAKWNDITNWFKRSLHKCLCIYHVETYDKPFLFYDNCLLWISVFSACGYSWIVCWVIWQAHSFRSCVRTCTNQPSCQHIGARPEQNGRYVADDIFLAENLHIFFLNLIRIVPEGPIDNKSSTHHGCRSLIDWLNITMTS